MSAPPEPFAASLQQGRPARRPLVAYALISGGPAAISPFAAVWLHDHGAAISMLGLCLAAPLMLRPLVVAPLTAWVSRFGAPWGPLAVLCAGAAMAAAWGITSSSLALCLAIWSLISLAAGACTPILDAAILSAPSPRSAASRLGQAKSAGAFAYLCGNLAIGCWASRIGLSAVMLWAAATGLLTAACLATSALRSAGRTRVRACAPISHEPDKVSATGASLALALGAVVLIEASHGMHAIAMIGWQARGLGPAINSMLWATGTLCDILFLGLAGPVCQRIGPSRLLMLGAGAAMVRWVGFALSPQLPMLFALQALHALSFTATGLASVQIAQALARRRATLGYQMVTWATSTGLAGAIAVVVAAPLYAELGTDAYWIMTILAGAGLMLALIFDRGFAPRRRLSPVLEASRTALGSKVTASAL